MKNKLFMLSIIITVLLCSCGIKTDNFDFESLCQSETLVLTNELKKYDSQTMMSEYEIEPDSVKNAIFLRPENPETDPTEIILIEVSGLSSVDSIKKVFATIQQKKYIQYESGNPEDFETVINYKTAIHDKFMIYVVSEDADKIIDRFTSFFD